MAAAAAKEAAAEEAMAAAKMATAAAEQALAAAEAAKKAAVKEDDYDEAIGRVCMYQALCVGCPVHRSSVHMHAVRAPALVPDTTPSPSV